MTVDLTALVADVLAGNAQRVEEVMDKARELGDGVPFVLLPVRIETRFVRVDEPIASPNAHLVDLVALLTSAGRTLQTIATTDVETERGERTAKEFRDFKKTVENKLAETASRRLQNVARALAQADTLLRDPLDGGAAEIAAATAATTAVHAGFADAAEQLRGLRSDFQRARLGEELAAVRAQAAPTLTEVEQRVLPAARLRNALANLPRRTEPGSATAPRVIRDASDSRAAGAVALKHADLARGAGTFERLLAEIEVLGNDAAAAERLATAATTIPLLPAAWKRTLLDAVTAARKRAPSADIDTLAAAVGAIRSDDRRLDATVPQPDLVVSVPKASRSVDQLLVRLYPDDLAVDTHEEALTEAELDAATVFWQQTAMAGTDEDARRAAWRALCGGRGTRRAAWIARVTEPLAEDQGPTRGARAAHRVLAALATFEKRIEEVSAAAPGARLDALVNAAEGLATPLTEIRPLPPWAIERIRERYAVARAGTVRLDAAARRATPDAAQRASLTQLTRSLRKLDLRISRLRQELPVDPQLRGPGTLKEGAWSRAATAAGLPDRFVVVAIADDGRTVAHVVAGAPVPGDLKLSLDPDPANPAAERFELDENGDLVVGTSIRWMVDYQEAVAKGMGVTIPITATEAQVGFDRLYVLGLRQGRARTGAAELEAMLDNHRFGRSGLELIAQGTPTNNTEQTKAGFTSDDDPDAAFALALGDPNTDLDDDGSRLGRALGLRERAFANVAGNDRHDCAEARTVMAALYPATLGGWLEENAVPLISLDTRNRLRAFALAHVSPRGQLPALRIGAQPYGLLPVTAYSRFVAEPREALGSGAPAAAQNAQRRFDRLLQKTLNKLVADWGEIREDNVAYATDDSITAATARERFLTLLGLEPVSSGAAYRYLVNVAGRHAPPSRAPELEFGLPPRSAGAVVTGAQFGPFEFLRRFETILRDAFNVPAGSPLTNATDGNVSDAFALIYAALQDTRAYGVRALKNEHALRGRLLPQDLGVLGTMAASTPETLAAGTGGQTLLTILARQSLLLTWREAAMRVLIAEGLLSEQTWAVTGSAGNFVIPSLLDPRTMTRWSYLLGRLSTLVAPGALTSHVGANGTMAGFVRGGYRTFTRNHAALIAPAEETAAAVAKLASYPADRLELLVREHLDLVSHRVDAWVTGLAQRRLTAMRADRPLGAHVGAYGWVEDLRPDDDDDLATNVPAALDGDPSRPVFADDDARFIHAPSVNHAVTAAILRSGYLSQGGAALAQNPMAVNLSSGRTRLALGLIDGVRAGNRLGALLGYRLERFLHEFHSQGPTLDAVIGPLRAAYPTVVGVDGDLSDDAAARAVCDGLAIADVANRWMTARGIAGLTVYEALSTNLNQYPWGFASNVLPPRGDARLDGVLRAIDHVADALDAVGDLVVAESVHQIALGNHPRAAAVMSALSQGAAPPRPEVVDTPRTGTPLTHRVLLQLPTAGVLAGWGPPTPRALAEPALDAAVGALLGNPDQIALRLVRVADDAFAGEVAVSDLGLHPIDLLEIIGPGLEEGLAEIGARALDALRPASFDDEAPPAPLRYAPGRADGWGEHVRSLDEVAPLLEALGEVVGRGRAATARDYLLGEHGPPAGDDGVDTVELSARVTAAADELTEATHALARLLAEDPALPADAFVDDPRAFVEAHATVGVPIWAERATWRAALLRVAAFGITVALPPTRFVTRVEVRAELREAAEEALVQAVTRLKQTAGALDGGGGVAALTAAARALFGEGFTILPHTRLRNRDDVETARAVRLASRAAVDGWLQGAGAVREGAGALADLLALADAHGPAGPDGEVAQLPHVPGEPWLGGTVPETSEPGGRLSLVLYGALPASDAPGVALLVDEWTEILPAAEETTGVAISYNQPDASPPQCVLVAVPARIRGNWDLGELFQTLHDTFELAKIRSVELEHLQTTAYGQLLPAVTGEVVPRLAGAPSATDDRVFLDFGANR